MAIGDVTDQRRRLSALLPPWFGDAHPVVDALLSGFATAQAFVYDLILFAKAQTRVRTATGGWLDMIATDFFGVGTQRQAGQSDASYRALILTNLFRERATRAAVVRVLTDLTGRTPTVFEPARVQDAGAYDTNTVGYDAAGAYGDMNLPFQAFVDAGLPPGSGIPDVSGYDVSAGGYDQPSELEYASLDMVQDGVGVADVLRAVDGVRPVATIVWVRVGAEYDASSGVVPDYSLIVGNKVVRFGASGGEPIRLLGVRL
jgi:hypothetical protein